MSHRSSKLSSIRTRAVAVVLCLMALAATVAPARAQSSQDPIYVFHTNLGNIRVQLFPDVAPQTVANFLGYVNSGAYNNSFIHRSVPNFVIQGGGYTADASGNISTISTGQPVVNEFHLSNTRGTLAMAKVGNDPNSATDQWFFNEVDNSQNLDAQNGGFTVFGKIVDSASLAVMDQISSVPTYTYSRGQPFDQLPLVNYQSGNNAAQSNFVLISSITPVWSAASLAAGPDGSAHLLWGNADGRTSAWTVDARYAVTSTPLFQPGAGWAARDLDVDAAGHTHLLWANPDGRMTVWDVDGRGNVASLPIFQPGGGWAAQALSMDATGDAHVLWTNPDGRAVVWDIDPAGRATSTPYFQPGGGWAARDLAVDARGAARLLWANPDGRMSVWTVPASGAVTSTPLFQPGGGWAATRLAVDGAGASRVLWVNPDGRMAVWSIDGRGAATSLPIFQPGGGWAARGLAADAAGDARVLWVNGDGRTSVWSITPAGDATSTPIYQP